MNDSSSSHEHNTIEGPSLPLRGRSAGINPNTDVPSNTDVLSGTDAACLFSKPAEGAKAEVCAAPPGVRANYPCSSPKHRGSIFRPTFWLPLVLSSIPAIVYVIAVIALDANGVIELFLPPNELHQSAISGKWLYFPLIWFALCPARFVASLLLSLRHSKQQIGCSAFYRRAPLIFTYIVIAPELLVFFFIALIAFSAAFL